MQLHPTARITGSWIRDKRVFLTSTGTVNNNDSGAVVSCEAWNS